MIPAHRDPGITAAQTLPEGITGLHFHTLCEQDADALEKTLDAVETRFGPWPRELSWLNFGGGHHIPAPATIWSG